MKFTCYCEVQLFCLAW